MQLLLIILGSLLIGIASGIIGFIRWAEYMRKSGR